jgi:hypothetical protein
MVPVSVAPQQINPEKALSLLELSLAESVGQLWLKPADNRFSSPLLATSLFRPPRLS